MKALRDSRDEGKENVVVTLDQVTSGDPGIAVNPDADSATLTIRNVPTTAVAWASAWVRQAYRDLVGRGPTPAEIAARLNQLGRGLSRTQVAVSIMDSTPNTAHPEANREIVRGIFRRFDGTVPEPGVVESYAEMLDRGHGVGVVEATIVTGRGATAAEFVAEAYRTLIGRAPTSLEQSEGVAQVMTTGRMAFATQLIDTASWRQREVTSLLTRYLGVAPSAMMIQGVARLEATQASGGMIGGRVDLVLADIIGSALYFQLP